jgi:hypothetical protein
MTDWFFIECLWLIYTNGVHPWWTSLQSSLERNATCDPTQTFHLPLSTEADELRILQSILRGVITSEDNDQWFIASNKAGDFFASQIYRLTFQHISSHFPSQWIWKSKCTSKHKYFAWLIVHDRINTKDMLGRRHWNVTSDHSCVQ